MKRLLTKIFDSINNFNSYVDDYTLRAKVPSIPYKAFVYVGRYWAEKQDLTKAKSEFDKAVALPVPTPDAYISIGTYHAINKNYDEAISAFKKAIRLDCYCATGYKLWASVLAEQGEFETALELFKKAGKLAPRDADVLFKWAGVLLKLGKYKEAKAKYTKVLFLNPEMHNSFFFLGLIAMEEEHFHEAVHNFHLALHYDKKHVDAMFYLALSLTRINSYEPAIAMCKKIIELDETRTDAYCLITQAYERLNQFDEAEKYYKLAEEKNAVNSAFYLDWGKFYKLSEKYELAKEKYLRVLQEETYHEDALFSLAFCQYQLDEIEEAEKTVDKVIELYPKNYDAIALKGRMEADRENYERAIEIYNNIISQTNTHNPLFLELANCYRSIEKNDLAEKYYEKMIEYFPKAYITYLEYAKMLADKKDFKAAMRKIRSAYALNKESFEICRLYGYILTESGFYTDALEKLSSANEINQFDLMTKLLKINTYMDMGLYKDALTFIEATVCASLSVEDVLRLMDLYYELAQNENSEYNIDRVRKMCDEIKNKFGEDNSILEREHNLIELNEDR